LAVLSDYSADRKLAAMGLAHFFDVVVTAQDPEVQRFKPDPAGLELVLQRLAVRMSEAVYIGDREDVDAVAASRAGMQYFILSERQGFGELSKLLIPRGGADSRAIANREL
jgi:FMN phosphatase YigB (HAD superfamily)